MAYKILIIDDDAELLKMLKRYFEIKKYQIITAENGAEGLSKMKLQAPESKEEFYGDVDAPEQFFCPYGHRLSRG